MSKASDTPVAATLRWVALAVAFCILIWALSDLVLLVFAAILLAVALRGAADALSSLTRLPVLLSLAVVVVLAFSFTAGFGWFFGPRFANEGHQLLTEISGYAGQIQQRYGGSFWLQRLHHAISSRGGFAIAPLAPKLLTVTFGTAGGFFLLLVTALYLAGSPRPYMRGAVLLVPPARHRRAEEILELLAQVLRHWMLGQLIDMAVVGVLATVGLMLLGIPLPLALGVLAGLLTFVPYVGAIIAGIPAIIVASTVSLASILWVVLLYLGCHIVEGYIVSPLVNRRTVRLPPAVTVLSMAVLGALYGILGILIATPLTAAIILLLRELYVRDYLGWAPEEEP